MDTIDEMIKEAIKDKLEGETFTFTAAVKKCGDGYTIYLPRLVAAKPPMSEDEAVRALIARWGQ